MPFCSSRCGHGRFVGSHLTSKDLLCHLPRCPLVSEVCLHREPCRLGGLHERGSTLGFTFELMSSQLSILYTSISGEQHIQCLVNDLVSCRHIDDLAHRVRLRGLVSSLHVSLRLHS